MSSALFFYNLKGIASHFNINGEAEHINDTFQVANKNTELPNHLLQRVNSYVFKNILLLINNIETCLAKLKGAVAIGTGQRAMDAIKGIGFVDVRTHQMCVLLNRGRESRLPLHGTHNDTKFNNVNMLINNYNYNSND